MLGLSAILSPLATRLITYSLAALLCLSLGAYSMHRWDASTVAQLKEGYAHAQAAALMDAVARQAKLDAVTMKEAEQASAKQAATEAAIAAQLKEARTHVNYLSTQLVHAKDRQGRTVTRTVGCVTYGLVRVLDGAVFGVTASSLRLPASVSDDTCAPVAADALARSVAANYGRAKLNAQQLDGLVHAERALEAVRSRKP